jgi:hypothetical protein
MRKRQENGREEKREEIAPLSDAQITMQIPTDKTERKRRGRRRRQSFLNDDDYGLWFYSRIASYS